MSEVRNADVQPSSETRMSETPQRAGVLERGLLIGGKSVPASSGKLADDVSPRDGEIYARVASGTPADITRAADFVTTDASIPAALRRSRTSVQRRRPVPGSRRR